MSNTGLCDSAVYVVPVYRLPSEPSWFHFLYGNVPGHQIDFMYRPELPQGSLKPQHFSHLTRLMKYIEPHEGCPYAFAIGNLSRDDAQHEPGHGGLALIFGFRISGAEDHSGRPDPPFAHAIAAVDQAFDSDALRTAALSFYEGLFGVGIDGGPSSMMYRTYAELGARDEGGTRLELLKDYTDKFEGLPRIPPSDRKHLWKACESAQPSRVVITYAEGCSFARIAECAARIAAMLFASDIRWSGISTGRESELPGGLTVRFTAVRQLSAKLDEGTKKIAMEDVPMEEGELARQLFGAVPMEADSRPAAAVGWRERFAPRQLGQGQVGEGPRVGGTHAHPKVQETAGVVEALPSKLGKTGQAKKAQPISLPGGLRPWVIGLVLLSAAMGVMLTLVMTHEMGGVGEAQPDAAGEVTMAEKAHFSAGASEMPETARVQIGDASVAPKSSLETRTTAPLSSAPASSGPVIGGGARPKASNGSLSPKPRTTRGGSLFGGKLD